MSLRDAAVAALERRLKHVFSDRELLDRALTHASVGDGAKRVRDNEVLEFIGDRVLGLLAAERLAVLYPKAPEGDLAPRLNALVSRETCARVARRMELGPALRLSGSETKTGGRDKDSILAGACEAVMAALYQDGGLEAPRAVFLAFWEEETASLGAPRPRDPKTALQEWAQGQKKPLPAYSVINRQGPDHAPRFTVEVTVLGLEPVRAEGRSRQEAEKAAAATLLQREGQS
ncbi:ribonuclease III [Caulobacter sp. CCUG 60055]|uniref:ribonuclease III n=2 Tax=Alphaproteobacteria TaxID=28211 RepID=UPI001FA7AD60|nr:ribonuclease III [Caulobacter sp. CCUG 60055]MBQ1541048.1 ribonuclease III [Caulobacteraceae bacterium]MCI3179047.1 ribonuclease III [Caulobacter sp. CCUG 60055]